VAPVGIQLMYGVSRRIVCALYFKVFVLSVSQRCDKIMLSLSYAPNVILELPSMTQ